jgi:hypothetical protein
MGRVIPPEELLPSGDVPEHNLAADSMPVLRYIGLANNRLCVAQSN